MTIDKIEKQISQVLESAKKYQVQAKIIQKQGRLITRQGEIKAREFLHQVFESGLTLMGQGFVSFRKASEAFVAETHRKVEKLQAVTEKADLELATDDAAVMQSSVSPLDSINENKKSKNPKFKSAKNKKQRSHLNNTSRPH